MSWNVLYEVQSPFSEQYRKIFLNLWTDHLNLVGVNFPFFNVFVPKIIYSNSYKFRGYDIKFQDFFYLKN